MKKLQMKGVSLIC